MCYKASVLNQFSVQSELDGEHDYYGGPWRVGDDDEALIGAAVIFTLQQQLQSYGSWSTLVIGLLLILIIRLAPQGIWVLLRQGMQWLAQMTIVRQPSLTEEGKDT